jgi:hypothetical protein
VLLDSVFISLPESSPLLLVEASKSEDRDGNCFRRVVCKISVNTNEKVPNVYEFKCHTPSLDYTLQKAVPLQAWSGPEGSRKLKFPDFMTTAQDDGKVVSLTHRPPLSQEIQLVLISVIG